MTYYTAGRRDLPSVNVTSVEMETTALFTAPVLENAKDCQFRLGSLDPESSGAANFPCLRLTIALYVVQLINGQTRAGKFPRRIQRSGRRRRPRMYHRQRWRRSSRVRFVSSEETPPRSAEAASYRTHKTRLPFARAGASNQTFTLARRQPRRRRRGKKEAETATRRQPPQEKYGAD